MESIYTDMCDSYMCHSKATNDNDNGDAMGRKRGFEEHQAMNDRTTLLLHPEDSISFMMSSSSLPSVNHRHSILNSTLSSSFSSDQQAAAPKHKQIPDHLRQHTPPPAASKIKSFSGCLFKNKSD